MHAYRATGALVLASPRGGVPIGSVVADALGAGFDLLMARRIDAGVALDDTGKTWRTNSVEADSRAGSLRAPPTSTSSACSARSIRRFASQQTRAAAS